MISDWQEALSKKKKKNWQEDPLFVGLLLQVGSPCVCSFSFPIGLCIIFGDGAKVGVLEKTGAEMRESVALMDPHSFDKLKSRHHQNKFC